MASSLKSDPVVCARRAILVLGMHRSGTSALTRILGLRGVALPFRTMPPGPDNETGFWEPIEIVRLHDEILGSAGSAWDDAAAFPEAWFTSDLAMQFKARLADMLRLDFPDAPPLIAVKDPRLCYLVPLWLSMFRDLGIEPLFIIPVRNPLEIAASLNKRNSLQEEHSLLLWLRHFLAAERNSRNYKRSFIAYDSLLRDWRGTLDKIGQDIEVSFPRQSPVSDAEITRFLSSELRHHTFADDDVGTRKNVAGWVRTAFSWALRAAERVPVDFDELDGISAGLAVADVAFMPLIAGAKLSVSNLRQDIQRITELQARKEDEFRRLDSQMLSDQAALRQSHDRMLSDQAALGHLRSEVAAGQRAAEALQNELWSEREEARRKSAEYNTARSDAEARIVSLQAANDQSRAALELSRHENHVILTSTSWRILAPVRAAAAAIPPPIRQRMRRGMKLMYWLATPRRSRWRLAFPRARCRVGTPVPADTISAAEPNGARMDPDDGLSKVAADAATPALGQKGDTGTQCVVVGIVAHNTPLNDLVRIINSARPALERSGDMVSGRIYILDNSDSLNASDLPPDIVFMTSANLGFGCGHNLCMTAAFDAGATAYIAANPDGSFHPGCIDNLLVMHHAQGERALIEAVQFPDEHPKRYDPVKLTTAWVSGACLLIPKSIWEQTGGFDPNFFMYCEDVDLSWRCRRLGFKTMICPPALFWHDVSGRKPEAWRRREMLVSGRYLAHKWGNPDFLAWAERQLVDAGFAYRSDELPPLDDLPTVPDGSDVSDFSFQFHFSPVRW